MSLKAVFNTMKSEGYVIAPLERYLLSMKDDSDRALNVNAPSSVGDCLRARFYSRVQTKKDGAVEPRTRRIFDNGSHVHSRLQEYLLKQGILLIDEVPVYNKPFNIQGHTDGFIRLSPTEIGILEIKSINTNAFQSLKVAKEEHEKQGMVYLYCSEQRRLKLRSTYKTQKEFDESEKKRGEEHALRYAHLKGGSKFTAEQKLEHQVKINLASDRILFATSKPITRCVFLYEDKNDQSLKEFCVSFDAAKFDSVLKEFEYLNEMVRKNTIPPRCEGGRSSFQCRFCDYKIECYN